MTTLATHDAARRALRDAIDREKAALAAFDLEPLSGDAEAAYVEAVMVTEARALALERVMAASSRGSSPTDLSA